MKKYKKGVNIKYHTIFYFPNWKLMINHMWRVLTKKPLIVIGNPLGKDIEEFWRI